MPRIRREAIRHHCSSISPLFFVKIGKGRQVTQKYTEALGHMHSHLSL